MSFSIVVQGTQLVAQWSPVQRAEAYELWSSPIAGPNSSSAAIVYSGGATNYTQNLQSLSNIAISNTNFESGGFNGWFFTSSNQMWTISTTQNNTPSGTYSALKTDPGDGTGNVGIYSAKYPALANALYAFSNYYYRNGGTTANMTLDVRWYDNTGTQIGATATAVTVSTLINTTWTLMQGNLISPASTAFVATGFSTAATGPTVYVDDFVIQGTSILTTLFYAVRAVSKNAASPFTSWQLPISQQGASPSFAPQQFGASIGDLGIDGRLLTPSDGVIKYFFLQ